MKVDKALLTNSVSLALVPLGLISPWWGTQITSIGLFALSGAVTNWLAVHMLFEKVPFMYGSGVIPNRFEEFKQTIKRLMMDQFFTEANLKRFIREEEASIASWLKADKLIDKIDYDLLFARLIEAIMQSSYGGLLGMIGGATALQNLKVPVIEKIRISLCDMVASDSFQQSIANSIDTESLCLDMGRQIETIVDKRLDELTPELVKQIVQQIIQEHLGWLVVWGGVLGGLIGFLASFIPQT